MISMSHVPEQYKMDNVIISETIAEQHDRNGNYLIIGLVLGGLFVHIIEILL